MTITEERIESDFDYHKPNEEADMQRWLPINQLPPARVWSRAYVFRDRDNRVYMGTYLDHENKRILSPPELQNAEVVEGLKVQ